MEVSDQTLYEEFVEMTEADPLFTDEFNSKLTEWLIEYNSIRPHKTLDYLTPHPLHHFDFD